MDRAHRHGLGLSQAHALVGWVEQRRTGPTGLLVLEAQDMDPWTVPSGWDNGWYGQCGPVRPDLKDPSSWV